MKTTENDFSDMSQKVIAKIHLDNIFKAKKHSVSCVLCESAPSGGRNPFNLTRIIKDVQHGELCEAAAQPLRKPMVS